MKTFEDLTTIQREKAIKNASYAIMEGLTSGVLEIELVSNDSQQALTEILTNAIKQDRPRIATMMILRNKNIRSEIERLALVVASESKYNEDGSLFKEGSNGNPVQH